MTLPKIMGIINVTPDSFFSGSRFSAVDAALKQALRMEEDGADILDIGGESSRPGASYISEQEEIDRVLPVIESIRGESDIQISVDTRKSAVAKEAVKLGIGYINDISALQDDPRLADIASKNSCRLILMHKKGIPESMQKNPEYGDLLNEIKTSLMVSVDTAVSRGVPRGDIILDPGIGFGKSKEHNRKILQNIDGIKRWGYPVLIGLSRKSYIGDILDELPEGRLYGTLAADIYAMMHGAGYIRVHDVKPHADSLKVLKDLGAFTGNGVWTG